MRSLKKIIKIEHPDARVNPPMADNWRRQIRSAAAVARRHQRGYRTVLLADEVGLGKTYVALTAMARHIFQSDENDRKVLLVVPPSPVLAAKWEQEILTFNEKFIRYDLVQAGLLAVNEKKTDVRNLKSKQMRPAYITGFWDMVENMHDFKDEPIGRLEDWKLNYFLRYFIDWWNRYVRKPRKGKLYWPGPNEVFDYEPGFISFRATYSRIAADCFLSEWLVGNLSLCGEMVDDLRSGRFDSTGLAFNALKPLFKKFAAAQDAYEPNILILRMGSIRQEPRLGGNPAFPISPFIAGRILSGLWSEKRARAFQNLFKSGLINYQKEFNCSKKKVEEWFWQLADGNPCGLKAIVDEVISVSGEKEEYRRRLIENDEVGTLLKGLRQRVLAAKMAVSGIDLVVIDEVHNWKNGGNGANTFRSSYAPYIRNKLIMSATPFQLDEDELGRIFNYVSPDQGRDLSVEVVGEILKPGGSVKRCLKAGSDFLASWKKLTPTNLRDIHETLTDDGTPVGDHLKRLVNSTDESTAAFAQASCRYRQCVEELGEQFGRVAIRHTKDHVRRHYHAGGDYVVSGGPSYSPNHRSLYDTKGYGGSENGLLSYIGMRAQQLLGRDCGDKGAVKLLRGINSSYDAYRESLNDQPPRQITAMTESYCRFFNDQLRQHKHPKVQATVDRALDNYLRGHKTLIFCERRATQREIFGLISERIKKLDGDNQLTKQRDKLLEDYLAVDLYWSRSYLTVNDRGDCWDGLDAGAKQKIIQTIDRELTPFRPLAPSLYAKLADLVLLNFMVQDHPGPFNDTGRSLADIRHSATGREALLDLRRGVAKADPGPDPAGPGDFTENAAIDDDPVSSGDDFRSGDTGLVIDHILRGRNIWHLGPESGRFHLNIWRILDSEHQQLLDSLSLAEADNLDSISEIMGYLLRDLRLGLRKVLLRLDSLRRLAEEGGVGADDPFQLLQKSLSRPDISPWHRAIQYSELLARSSGSLMRGTVEASRRQSLWRGVYLRGGVTAFMNGDTAPERRVNLCAAFNSPLMPDILVCTAIGSEGIDLHLYCAEVIHHDLPWNPAKLEQRTGRIDRVGCLAERINRLDSFKINIGIPFLAHNYDEFNYRQLLARAQKQDVLLNAPEFVAASIEEEVFDVNDEARVTEPGDEDGPDSLDPGLGALPESLLEYLKISLNI